jgi:hypothetical protein
MVMDDGDDGGVAGITARGSMEGLLSDGSGGSGGPTGIIISTPSGPRLRFSCLECRNHKVKRRALCMWHSVKAPGVSSMCPRGRDEASRASSAATIR